MIKDSINSILEVAIELKSILKQDIEDVKEAKHENLLTRNETKLELMQKISNLYDNLNILISEEIHKGIDVNVYTKQFDTLEIHLRELYDLNGKLANIVLPVKEMYKEIIDEITIQNGGSLIEVQI